MTPSEHQHTHKTFDPNFALSERDAGTKMEQRLKEWPANNCRYQSLTMLMILCYAYKEEPSTTVFWEALPAADWHRCRYLELNIGWRLGTPTEELGEKLKALKEMATTQEDQQGQLSWTPGSSHRLSHQPKSMHGLDGGHRLPCSASVREDVPNPIETWCARVGGYPEGSYPLRSEVVGGGRRDPVKGEPGGRAAVGM